MVCQRRLPHHDISRQHHPAMEHGRGLANTHDEGLCARAVLLLQLGEQQPLCGISLFLNSPNSSRPFFQVGNKNGDVKTYNLSTGKIVDNNAVINVRFAVTSVVFDPLGRLLFAGTENGEVHVFSFSAGHGSFTKVYRTSVSNNGPHAILSLALAPAFAKETYQPCLLVSAKDNTVKLLGYSYFLLHYLLIPFFFPLLPQRWKLSAQAIHTGIVQFVSVASCGRRRKPAQPAAA